MTLWSSSPSRLGGTPANMQQIFVTHSFSKYLPRELSFAARS